ncbi:MAG: TRAP transporter small permease subunit [Pseudomonadales bacterium]|jgi:TRAP-type C4-dicarboxylate transport system permease small subunit|nr:TRAP transporter small permease subunit [Pseudomonadales bacterium]MDP7595638.1 TRAP transporter small permease subunit [Pseudomonadales bacterium]HJN49642.1 TRAP transporter small permease subunit [Pseudomonadales bacterium]|tara:strand:+ start:751 stop:1242 length:492 start_codon:yes stop_codon:yes gene_type:complete
MIMDLKHPVRVIHLIEDSALVISLLTMMTVAVVQIALRNFFDSGMFWADSFVRILVLWVALLGAMVATRENNHIKIDVLSRYLPEHIDRHLSAVVGVVASVVCAVVAWYCAQFVLLESEDPSMAFAQVPHWVCELILPFAFAVMSLRFLLGTVNGYLASVADD